MNASDYERLTAKLQAADAGPKIATADRLCVVTVCLVYIAYLCRLGFAHDARFWALLIIPAVGLLLITAVRAGINAPRPYESLDITPLTPSDTKGKSCPSRHVACAALIAAVMFPMNWVMGSGVMILAVVLCVTRVIGGVHFPRDVIVGVLFGTAIGLLGYVIRLLIGGC